jgi:hypothetical protein
VGKLSLLVFLEVYIACYGLHDVSTPISLPDTKPWLRIATDNDGLISRITTAFAGAALCSEYDVVHEIVEIERRLLFRLQWEHVLGHQDQKKKWHELTWMETLNARADAHATAGLNVPGAPATIAPLMPSSEVALRMDRIDITSKRATHLRKAATKPAMLNLFHIHCGWNLLDVDSIDWKAHHGALGKLTCSGKKFATKFIFQLLPMGKTHHKIDPAQSVTCSSCKVHPECEAHLCQCPARRIVIEAFLQEDLGQFLEDNHTCPALAHMLLDPLHSEVLGDTPTFQRRHGDDDPRFRALLQAQTNVGWSQFFQGRLVAQWALLQDDFLATNNKEFKLDRRCWTGDIWAHKLISLLWLAMRAHWVLRNADGHGRNQAANHAIRHARLITAIEALYADSPLMLAADRTILDAEPIPDNTVQQPARLELWAQRTRTIINQSKVDATAAILRTHERLTHYFQRKHADTVPTPPTPTPPAIKPHHTNHTFTSINHNHNHDQHDETESENPEPIQHPTITTFTTQTCATSLRRSCEGAVCSVPQQQGDG